MTIKERFQRLVSRKSLSSGHSSSSSNSDPSDAPPIPYASSSGTSTPTSATIPISAHPPAINPSPTAISASLSKTSPASASSFQNTTGGFLHKTLTWRSSRGGSSSGGAATKKEKKRSSGRSSDRKGRDAAAGLAAARRRVHPSERPLTEANLRQQEALSAFKWEFGRSRRRDSLGAWSDESGISPCGSRRPSLISPPGA
ncbi:hypothetical protein NKR19_g3291 [Coniochaeta hoffmannii]|uniref:Uncharacterized protein n=1 Tax=Coniochaeta hoffmannii TaxID=91930 RepID=A0AA38S3X4_9PEZI|nr:hypothetical protein NKR19_g3291 [Coniochaeta hoffmannii]